MQELGQFLLLVTFLATLTTALTAVAGALTQNLALMRGARYGLYGVAALNIAMAIVLTHGFLTHEFGNKYIAAYSDTTMPTMYLVASFWGGEKGALLFWATSLAIFAGIAVHGRRQREPVYLSWVIAVLTSSILFFEVLMLFESSPFETFVASGPPQDGKGLNPLLQHPAMAFHPPSLLTGYITFTIPFAFGAAALITGKLDSQWISDTRTWTMLSWCFLSIGMVLGALWAYEELGWGFYWMWDPVENAPLISWFTATAFLHSVMIQERRGMLKRWNAVLVCLTFLLTIFGTFLTRSQLIDSIHAFANSTLAIYFLWYMLGVAIVSVILIAWRWGALKSEDGIDSIWSRESMFVMNNVFLVGSAFIVLWGTLFPKISELPSVQQAYNQVTQAWNSTVGVLVGPMESLDQAVTLGEPWFNRIMTPVGLLLLMLMGVGPLIPWRRTTRKAFRRNFFTPLTGSLLITAVGATVASWLAIGQVAEQQGLSFGEAYGVWADGLEVVHVYTVFAYLFCLFVTWTIGREFHVATRIRRRKYGGPYSANLMALMFKNPRRYGGYVIHLGVVLMFIAFTGKVFKIQQPERPMTLGDDLTVSGYSLTYSHTDEAWDEDNGYAATKATITVVEDDETVAEREVEDLVGWLESRDVGVFHVETALGSPKVRVRFEDHAARDRLRDDVWLARHFVEDFRKVGADEAAHTQTWQLRDMRLLKVVPMLAMQKVRDARAAMGPGSTVGARVQSREGSPQVDLVFDDAEAMAGFDARLASLEVPETALYGGYDARHGALEFVDARTGTQLHPEVRYYAKHSTPTTETAIASSIHEDLYVAMRPAMGQDFINLLPVVFPLVTFLWTGAFVLLLGTLIALTPRWLAQTLVGLARGPTPAVAAAVVLLLVGLLAGGIAQARPGPAGVAPPPSAERAVEDVLRAFTCDCGPRDAPGAAARTLADEACACEEARSERAMIAELMSDYSDDQKASGRAKLDVLERLVDLDATWDARLRYDAGDYRHLLSTTKTTCPGERGLALSQSQISCSVRNRWLPRFRRMLAAGMSEDAIYRYYVDVNNATMDPASPWTYEDLRANPDKPLSWAFPTTLIAGLLVGLLVFFTRRGRRTAEEVSPSMTAPTSDDLSERQRLLLEDELDILDS
ncbi:MAG: cytochrome c-type biogenesis CcmF C-terminal domain-containing protein [Myxococcota bacterium]